MGTSSLPQNPHNGASTLEIVNDPHVIEIIRRNFAPVDWDGESPIEMEMFDIPLPDEPEAVQVIRRRKPVQSAETRHAEPEMLTVQDVAGKTRKSDDWVRRYFDGVDGVKHVVSKPRRGKRPYVTLLIPIAVYEREKKKSFSGNWQVRRRPKTS